MEKPFKIDTQTKGAFVISDDCIERFFFNLHETSKGLIVKSHFQEIHRALYTAWILREGKTVESISAYYHKEEDLKDAPSLETVVKAMEHQVDLFTEGAYGKYAEARKNENHRGISENRYWREIQDIYTDASALKEGRYYENKIHHRPGVPRIETIGKRLVDAIVDLAWKMDSDAPGIQEHVDDIMRKTNENFEKLWEDDPGEEQC